MTSFVPLSECRGRINGYCCPFIGGAQRAKKHCKSCLCLSLFERDSNVIYASCRVQYRWFPVHSCSVCPFERLSVSALSVHPLQWSSSSAFISPSNRHFQYSLLRHFACEFRTSSLTISDTSRPRLTPHPNWSPRRRLEWQIPAGA